MRRFIVIGLLLAGDLWADDSTLSFDQIFESDGFRTAEPPAPRWLQDGSGFLSSQDEGVVLNDLETGRRELIVPRERLNLPGGGTPGRFEQAAWTRDRRRFPFPGNGQGSWLLDFTAEGLRRIGKGLGAISGAQFSPDGSRVAYVHDRAWRKIIYKRHGVLPVQNQAASLRTLLSERPYLDPERIGVYGWSGGALVSTHLIVRHPDLYSTAMAGAGISHHRFYHAAFTERFLGLPQDNPEVYKATASLNLAQTLKGNLLLIHGTGDSNVHYQSSEALINALIAAKKRFTMMAYPDRNHGMRESEHMQYHLYDLYTWYLETHILPGPRD